ncbi:hypothetical protein VP01_1181g1 [Puccinia sorghi]|uniref:Uncharacterized protein n=1 Tax=Puccinia sorghi TaxID=27349 RepID=A0A0L6VQZ7_9BASI|nr:hypothetical protein VP01_1181g1 [Puccinia sorghi]
MWFTFISLSANVGILFSSLNLMYYHIDIKIEINTTVCQPKMVELILVNFIIASTDPSQHFLGIRSILTGRLTGICNHHTPDTKPAPGSILDIISFFHTLISCEFHLNSISNNFIYTENCWSLKLGGKKNHGTTIWNRRTASQKKSQDEDFEPRINTCTTKGTNMMKISDEFIKPTRTKRVQPNPIEMIYHSSFLFDEVFLIQGISLRDLLLGQFQAQFSTHPYCSWGLWISCHLYPFFSLRDSKPLLTVQLFLISRIKIFNEIILIFLSILKIEPFCSSEFKLDKYLVGDPLTSEIELSGNLHSSGKNQPEPPRSPHTAKKNLLKCLQLTCRNSQEASVVTPTIIQNLDISLGGACCMTQRTLTAKSLSHSKLTFSLTSQSSSPLVISVISLVLFSKYQCPSVALSRRPTKIIKIIKRNPSHIQEQAHTFPPFFPPHSSSPPPRFQILISKTLIWDYSTLTEVKYSYNFPLTSVLSFLDKKCFRVMVLCFNPDIVLQPTPLPSFQSYPLHYILVPLSIQTCDITCCMSNFYRDPSSSYPYVLLFKKIFKMQVSVKNTSAINQTERDKLIENSSNKDRENTRKSFNTGQYFYIKKRRLKDFKDQKRRIQKFSHQAQSKRREIGDTSKKKTFHAAIRTPPVCICRCFRTVTVQKVGVTPESFLKFLHVNCRQLSKFFFIIPDWHPEALVFPNPRAHELTQREGNNCKVSQVGARFFGFIANYHDY